MNLSFPSMLRTSGLRRPLLGSFFLCLLLGARTPLLADIIILKNGNQMQGEVVHQDKRYITIQIPNGLMRIERRQIKKIQSESRQDYLISEGEKHQLRRDFRGAIDLYRQVLAEEPANKEALDGLVQAQENYAHSLFKSNQFVKANKAYNDIIELKPEHHGAQKGIRKIQQKIEELAELESLGKEQILAGEVEEGLKKLKKIYDNYPDQRSGLEKDLATASIRLGAKAQQDKDWDTAESYYLDALSYDPLVISKISNYYAALKTHQLNELARDGDFKKLAENAEKALAIAPEHPFLLYFQGLGLQGTGHAKDAALLYLKVSERERPSDLEGSVSVLRKAAELKLSGLDPNQAEEEVHSEVLPGKWRKITTDHFVVYHHNNKVGKAVATMAEKTYWKLFRNLGCKTHWHKRCQIYIHPSKQYFLKASSLKGWTGGSHQIIKSQGALSEHRIQSFQTQSGLVQSIIPHEVTHAMVAHRTRYRGELPLWINEGLAMLSEPEAVREYYSRKVSENVKLNQHFRINKFVKMDEYPEADQVQSFYAQCYSLTNFLVKRKGMKKFLSFVEELLLAPDSLDLLLKRHYRISSTAALGNLWKRAKK